MTQLETEHSIQRDGKPEIEVDPITQAGQDMLAELIDQVKLKDLKEKRNNIIYGRDTVVGIFRGWFVRGYKRKDLRAAEEATEEAKARVAFLRELVEGDYRFTEKPHFAYYGREEDPKAYEIEGTTFSGKKEFLSAYGVGYGEKTAMSMGFSQKLGESEPKKGKDAEERVRGVGITLHAIYARAGIELRRIS